MRPFSLFGLLILLSPGCGGDSCGGGLLGATECSLDAPEEFLSNPSIDDAIAESDFPIYPGTTPPPLIGDYEVAGEVLSASPNIRSMVVGRPINSQFTLYDQTTSGRISFRETVPGITARGTGGYITGRDGSFTIYQESIQSGPEAGLPDEVTASVALIMSGTKQQSGDLIAEGLSIVTRYETTNPDYESDEIEGTWWKWRADLELLGPPTPSLAHRAFIESGFPFSIILTDLLRKR